MSRKLEFMGKKKECEKHKDNLIKKGKFAIVKKFGESEIRLLNTIDPKFRKKLHTHGVYTFTYAAYR